MNEGQQSGDEQREPQRAALSRGSSGHPVLDRYVDSASSWNNIYTPICSLRTYICIYTHSVIPSINQAIISVHITIYTHTQVQFQSAGSLPTHLRTAAHNHVCAAPAAAKVASLYSTAKAPPEIYHRLIYIYIYTHTGQSAISDY